jgi:hypothetical protein
MQPFLSLLGAAARIFAALALVPLVLILIRIFYIVYHLTAHLRISLRKMAQWKAASKPIRSTGLLTETLAREDQKTGYARVRNAQGKWAKLALQPRVIRTRRRLFGWSWKRRKRWRSGEY